MAPAVAFNSAETPVVVDFEGRSIEGQGWGVVETTADEVKELGEAGVLRVYPTLADEDGIDDRARDAVRRAETIRKRASSLQQVRKEDLLELAGPAGVRNPNDLDKPDLVRALAWRPDYAYEEPLKAIRAARKADEGEPKEETGQEG